MSSPWKDYPRITVNPVSSDDKREGQDITLQCSADSNPSPAQLMWSFGQQTWSTGIHQLSNLSRSDTGTYTCKASVKADSTYGDLVRTKDVSVTVRYAPDVTMEIKKMQGDSVVMLTCQANGFPTNYVFSKFRQIWNGQQVRELSGNTLTATGQYHLTITPVSYQDSGFYECTVQNGIPGRNGEINQRARGFLNIKAPPVFVSDKTTNIFVRIGQSTALSRVIFANPQITNTTWKKEGILITEKSGLVQTIDVQLKVHGTFVNQACENVTLLIDSVMEKDQGIYEIDICNSIGCSASQFTLKVGDKPGVPKKCLCLSHTNMSIEIKWMSTNIQDIQKSWIQFRSSDESNWNNATLSNVWFGSDGTVHANITHLHEGTLYYFRIYPGTTADKSDFCETSFPTLGSMKYERMECSSSESILGKGIGIGVAASAGVAVLVIVILGIMWRGSILCFSHRLDKGSKGTDNMYSDISMDTMNQRHPGQLASPDLTEVHQYESLQGQNTDPTTYNSLKMNSNVSEGEPKSHLYENTS